MFGAAEQDIQIQPTPIWIHLTYQTAFVDDDGKLQIRRDVYNLDSRILAAIKGERAMSKPSGKPSPQRKREPEIASTPGHRKTVRNVPPRGGDVFHSLFSGGPTNVRSRPTRSVYYR
jgi:hypothetical protein